jgi:hypothetical protein
MDFALHGDLYSILHQKLKPNKLEFNKVIEIALGIGNNSLTSQYHIIKLLIISHNNHNNYLNKF